MLVSIDLAEVLSSGRLRRRTPMDDMSGEITGSNGIRSPTIVLFLTVWFQREQCEDLRYVAIMRHVFNYMVKSVAENNMKAEIWGLVMVVLVLLAVRF
jgi:hypothetical protein